MILIDFDVVAYQWSGRQT